MKILLINWQDPANPHAGGAEIHLHEVFSRIHEAGHPVTWLVSGWSGSNRRDDLDGMEIHRTASRYTFGPAAPLYYRRRLANRGFDVVVEALNKVPVYSPLWSASPVVLLVHHLFGTTAFREASFPLAAMTWLQERPIRRIYRGVPVQAISRSTAGDLVARGLDSRSVSVIHPGVDLNFFHPGTSLTRSAEPTFLYLGRLRKYKRVDLIIRAFARHALGNPTSRLVIAGKGDAEPGLRKLAARNGVESRVDFLGYVTEKTKRDLLRRCWANVFVSPKEGWGITNLEAAACGTPSIASDSPGLRESVIDSETGILVPHGDLAALCGAMERLAAAPALLAEMGDNALRFARTFTWERAAARTEAHLATSARPRQRGPTDTAQASG